MTGRCFHAAILAAFFICVFRASAEEKSEEDYQVFNDPEDDCDDTEDIVRTIEQIAIAPIAHVPSIERVNVSEVDTQRASSQWMIKRFSLFQSIAVNIRRAYERLLRGHAAWMCQWYEVHVPEFYSCVTWRTVKVVNDQYRAYPKTTLNHIKIIKEILIKSHVRKIPLRTLSRSVSNNLDEIFNGFVKELIRHEEHVQRLAKEMIKEQVTKVRVKCVLPFGDRHPYEATECSNVSDKNDATEGATYDFEPMEYQNME